MRRSRTAPTALGGAAALSAASLPAGLDQLPVDLTAGFASLPPLPLGTAATGLLPVGGAPLGLAGLSAPLPGTTISASLIGGSAGAAAAAAMLAAADNAAAAAAGVPGGGAPALSGDAAAPAAITPTATPAVTPTAAGAAAAGAGFAAPFGAAALPQLPAAGAGAELAGMGQPKRSTADADLDGRFCQAVRLFGRDLKVRGSRMHCSCRGTFSLRHVQCVAGYLRKLPTSCRCLPTANQLPPLQYCLLPTAPHRTAPTSPPQQAVSHFLGNKTVAATRLYWSRHRERLALDAIMAERAAAGLGPEDHAPGAATAVPIAPAAAAAAGLPDLQQAWAPLLDHFQRQAAAGEAPANPAAAAEAAGAQPGGAAAGAEPAAAAAQADAAGPGVEPTAMQVDAPAAAAAVKPEPVAAAGPAAPAAAAEGAEQPAADEGAAQPGATLPVGEPTAAGGEAAAFPMPSAAEAASLLPREELTKLQTLLEPGQLNQGVLVLL